MSSRTQTTEVLLRWKYVTVRRSLYTHKQFTISEAEIFRYEKNLWDNGIFFTSNSQELQ